jgi:hypothetical protein
MVDIGQGRSVQQAQGDPFVCQDRDFVDAVQWEALFDEVLAEAGR